jgi:hypothetical protein
LEVFRYVFNDYSFIKLALVFLVFTLMYILSQKVKINTKQKLKKSLANVNTKNFSKYRKEIHENKLFKVLTELNIRNDIVFYILFLFLLVIFTVAYIYKISDLIILSYVFVFITYIAFKIY